MITEYTAEQLLQLLDGFTCPVDSQYEPLMTFDLKDGWKVVVFYDCESFDYLDEFIAPNGQVVDFWEFPESEARQRLIDWSPLGQGG